MQTHLHQVGELGLGENLLVHDAGLLQAPLAVQRVVVRGDLTGDHVLADAEGGFHHHAVLAVVDRVDGEHHARLGGIDHLLHDDGHLDVVEVALVLAVEQRAFREEGQPALDDLLHHLIEGLDEEIGLLLSGVGRVVAVLGTSRGTDRDRGALRKLVVLLLDQVPRWLGGGDHGPRGVEVLGLEVPEQLGSVDDLAEGR